MHCSGLHLQAAQRQCNLPKHPPGCSRRGPIYPDKPAHSSRPQQLQLCPICRSHKTIAGCRSDLAILLFRVGRADSQNTAGKLTYGPANINNHCVRYLRMHHAMHLSMLESTARRLLQIYMSPPSPKKRPSEPVLATEGVLVVIEFSGRIPGCGDEVM